MSTPSYPRGHRRRFGGVRPWVGLALLASALAAPGCVRNPEVATPRFDREGCPEGTTPATDTLPTGLRKAWCERTGPDGEPVKHGPYAAWHPNGRQAVEGAYLDGRESGLWTLWYPSGQVSEEGGYRAGKPHGQWTGWSEDGRKIMVMDFRDGEIVCGEEALQPECR